MCPCGEGNQPFTSLYQQECYQQVKGSGPSPLLGTGETLIGISEKKKKKTQIDISESSKCSKVLKAEIEETMLSQLKEEKAEVEILLFSIKTY